eukprot:TRINITY_DN28339_c0_g1_i1.p1 TRINITY_DN28339_c0_g1~~TRINITY_DN28339_c0_g1_i1.p1  ORF type:complete len:241 (-),score=39.49 TRINITY_DN28339_c0_g1_i1:63-728(-)
MCIRDRSGGNLSSILAKYGALEEKTIKVYARQILKGLEYLHNNRVIHKDIKGANILVDSNGTVKLADFGCSMQIDKTLSAEQYVPALKGSIPWMAPEVVKQSLTSRRSDIWSFGCTVVEMTSGKTPWSNYDFDNHLAAILKIGLSDEIPLLPTNISEELRDFILRCLRRDPTERWTASELLQHPFLRETPKSSNIAKSVSDDESENGYDQQIDGLLSVMVK